jgi:hypothetical protein
MGINVARIKSNSATKTILMNKVIYHLYDIYIASPLLKKRFGYKLFAIN